MKHHSNKFAEMRVGNSDILGAALKSRAVVEHVNKLKDKFEKISKEDKEQFLLGFIIFLWQGGIRLGKKEDISKVLTNPETTKLRKSFAKALEE